MLEIAVGFLAKEGVKRGLKLFGFPLLIIGAIALLYFTHLVVKKLAVEEATLKLEQQIITAEERHKAREAFLERQTQFTREQLKRQKEASAELEHNIEAANAIARELEKEIAEAKKCEGDNCFVVDVDFLKRMLRIKEAIASGNYSAR